MYFPYRKKRLLSVFFYIAISTAAIIFAIRFLYRYNVIPHKSYSDADFGIEAYVSGHDEDCDGIDDQTDILEGAYGYVAKKPRYKSKYYESGYPDDSCGVCTDVVAQGLLNAGYDLMTLVQEDISLHPQDYAIEEPDKNIDFRRVRNLEVYFRHTAIPLTTDILKRLL